jgi:purine-cytosine permease-like protein
MFADYSRYTRSGSGSLLAVFLGLGLTSAWLMPLGFLAARAAGTSDPASMLEAVGLGTSGGLLLALGTVTTNFVNIYLSALAWRSLLPGTPQQLALWATGLVGALLSLLSRRWLDSYGDFMVLLGGAFVPVGGILIAHYFLLGRPVEAGALYDARGPYSRQLGFSIPGVVAWASGALVYYGVRGSGVETLGSTLPAFVTAVGVYAAAERALSGAAGSRPW